MFGSAGACNLLRASSSLKNWVALASSIENVNHIKMADVEVKG